jgi:enoyl-CoA hydratase
VQQSSHDNADFDKVVALSPLLTYSEIVTLCETPWGLEGYSPLGEHHYLLLDTTCAVDSPNGKQLDKVAERLRLLPCPVIAVGTAAGPELCRGVDVVVRNVREAAPLVKNIDEHPLAAMTLVQLLRHNEDATPEQGLFAESLAYASLQGGAEFAHVKREIQSARRATNSAREEGAAVLLERGGNELRITLNRPDARNAYSVSMRDGLHDALQLLKMDETLSRAVISGEGSCFCIGGDMTEFGMLTDTSVAHAIRSSRSVGQLLLELRERLEFRLHRACLGSGIELPAFGARVVATNNAFMQLPEIKLGLLPGAGGTVSILRRIGRQRTAYLALSARRISAATALHWGLIDAIV